MNGNVELLKHLYDRFNARDIDGVLDALADDVVWANGNGRWLRPWPRSRTCVLDTLVGHGQSARRACDVSSNRGWRDHRGSPADHRRSRRPTASRTDARA